MSDRWMRDTPFTAKELADFRREIMKRYEESGMPFPDQFTCDLCTMAPSCALAFDLYNTDGDCLYDK